MQPTPEIMITNFNKMKKARYNKGFSLVELIIVVTIIGILASIAYPSYIQHVRTANRTDAQGDLLEAASTLERSFTENNTYVGAPAPSNTDHYTYSLSNLGISTYTLTATPIGEQTKDTCGTMTLTQSGATTPSHSKCWR